MVKVALAADGYTVSTAANGRDALHHLRSTPSTCLIVLDLLMPAMDGESFRAAQLKDRSLAWIPLVVISGAIEGPFKARQLEAAAFLPKPLDLDEVRAQIHRLGCGRVAARAARVVERAGEQP